MAQRYPRYRAKASDAIAIDFIDESLQPFAEELGGGLNEHNWFQNITVGARALQSAGYALRVKTSHKTVNHAALTSGYPVAAPANAFKIPMTTSWVDIDDLTLSFNSRGGLLWVIAGVQVCFGTTPATTDYYTRLVGAQLGLAIDGSIQGECVIGGSERDIDPNGDTLKIDHIKYRLTGLFPVPPGPISVSVQGKTGRNQDYEVPGANLYVAIQNRQLIVIEAH